jgi:hypothetical protein
MYTIELVDGGITSYDETRQPPEMADCYYAELRGL